MTPALMLITALGGPMNGSVSALLYSSLAACEDATRTVSDTLDYDHTLKCVTGGMVSSPRPKRNPIYGD